MDSRKRSDFSASSPGASTPGFEEKVELNPAANASNVTHVASPITNAPKQPGWIKLFPCWGPRKPNEDADFGERDMSAPRADGKKILQEDEVYDQLGFSFPGWKKWTILSVIFAVQVSMNFNTSLYANAIPGMSKEFGVSEQAARAGAAIFLITYAFGCELWAPWSEEFGRKSVLQLSLLFVNIFQIPVALAPNFATVMIGRALGGLASAGGSVTLGMVADMWEPEQQQYAVAFVVFSSVGGSVIGPIVGGFTETYLHWRWSIWIQLILGAIVQFLHFWVPETRSTVLIDRIAKEKRKTGQDTNIYGPNEVMTLKERLQPHEAWVTILRPFKMFIFEPIVLVLSLLSGFSDALIFMFIASFGLVYKQWDFSAIDVGLTFVAIFIGYFAAWGIFVYFIKRNIKERERKPNDDRAQFESRLKGLLWTAPLLPLGLLGFAFTISGPPLPWIASCFFIALVGIANYAIYMATIDYMITAYGPYSASATGGNGWARDFLAGVLTVPATPFFSNIGSDPLRNATLIVFAISLVLVLAVFVIYRHGSALRFNSPFAQKLSAEREAHVHPPISPGVVTGQPTTIETAETGTGEKAPGQITETQKATARPTAPKRGHSYTRSQQNFSLQSAMGSHVRTPRRSPRASGTTTPTGLPPQTDNNPAKSRGHTPGHLSPGIEEARTAADPAQHAANLKKAMSQISENTRGEHQAETDTKREQNDE